MLGLTVSPGGAVPGLKARVVGRHSLQARWLVPELLLLPIGLAFGKATGSPVPLIAVATGAVPLRRWRLRRRVAAEARRRATAVIDLCAGLAAELRSGATPDQALDEVTARTTSLRAGLGDESVARLSAGRYGADVPAALRAIADLPGGRGAAAVAACWRVTAESGTGLAAGLDQLADALRAERALTEEIAGELAAPRATIAVLAALPLIGLLLGGALGAEPVQVLLHTPAGLACLTVGALLEAAGLGWTARIVRGAADSPDERPRGRAPAACGLSRINAGRREVAW
jgi:tight adherence protein B